MKPINYVLVFLITGASLYLLGAFISLEPDIVKWGRFGRLIWTLLWLLFSVLICQAGEMSAETKKKR